MDALEAGKNVHGNPLSQQSDSSGYQSPDYCNEKVVERNRLPARSYYIPEGSLLLNGTWEFNYVQTLLNAPEPRNHNDSLANSSSSSLLLINGEGEIEEPESAWSQIEVPGHWQLQGYGSPQYTNVPYPFPVCPPYVPSENPTGTYRRRFTVPRAWDEQSQLRLRFDGVDSAFHIWINGVAIGYSQGSRNPAEFDVTAVLKRDAENELFIRVYQWSDGSYIEDQDQWWLSGELNIVQYNSGHADSGLRLIEYCRHLSRRSFNSVSS
jgi:beta-galactosidase